MQSKISGDLCWKFTDEKWLKFDGPISRHEVDVDWTHPGCVKLTATDSPASVQLAASHRSASVQPTSKVLDFHPTLL